MKFISNYLNIAHFQILYHDSLFHEEPNYKFLRLELDKHMNWKMHIKLILPKLNSACHAIRCMKHYCNIQTLKMLYHAYFHSIVAYGVIFWGNSTDVTKVFLLQKSIIRIMMGIRPRNTCRPLFKSLRIMTVSSQYILALMKFLVKNLECFMFNNGIHTNFTRNRMSLHVPRANLPLSQQGMHYMCIKVFNKLPKYVTDSSENKKQFIRKVKNLLFDQASCSVHGFLNFNYD
jgi:hypothetical protein